MLYLLLYLYYTYTILILLLVFDNCFKENLIECTTNMSISSQGRKLLLQQMESALIPRSVHSTVRDLKPLDKRGNGVPSYTVYKIIDLGTDTNMPLTKKYLK